MAPKNPTLTVHTSMSTDAISLNARTASTDNSAVKIRIEGPADAEVPREGHIPGRAAERYKSLAAQFATFVLISTFSVGLIVSFLSFAGSIMLPQDPSNEGRMFNIGMLFSFIAMGCHFGVIIVGGRATAVCFRIATPPTSHIDVEAAAPEDPAHAVFRETLRRVDFTRYITYCERLLLLGTFFLLASMLFMAFFIFSQLVYPLVLAGLSLLGACTVYRTGFWSVSALNEDIKRLVFRREQRRINKQILVSSKPEVSTEDIEQPYNGVDSR